MKNNKGFSLVELIIVIAIMAILVGVMAPQLIKYIEKTNVSADVQLCDSVREAIQTAMMDPSVITAKNSGVPSANQAGLTASFPSNGTPFQKAVYEIIGTSNPKDQIKSSAKGSGDVKYSVGTNSVLVFITSSDMSGNKKANTKIDVDKPEDSIIYAGDTTLKIS